MSQYESAEFWLLLQKNSSMTVHNMQLQIADPLPLCIFTICQLPLFAFASSLLKTRIFFKPRKRPKMFRNARNIGWNIRWNIQELLKKIGRPCARTQPAHSCSALSHCAAAFTARAAPKETTQDHTRTTDRRRLQ